MNTLLGGLATTNCPRNQLNPCAILKLQNSSIPDTLPNQTRFLIFSNKIKEFDFPLGGGGYCYGILLDPMTLTEIRLVLLQAVQP